MNAITENQMHSLSQRKDGQLIFFKSSLEKNKMMSFLKHQLESCSKQKELCVTINNLVDNTYIVNITYMLYEKKVNYKYTGELNEKFIELLINFK
jgi:hypothetical protein